MTVECAADRQIAGFQTSMTSSGDFKVLKHSMDGSPIRTRDKDGAIVKTEVLNQRLFVRWGRGPLNASRVVIPGCEMRSTDALSMIEAIDRVFPGINIESLRSYCATCRTGWYALVGSLDARAPGTRNPKSR